MEKDTTVSPSKISNNKGYLYTNMEHYIRRAHIIWVLNYSTVFLLKLKQLHNDVKYFKIALKDILCRHSFYTTEEYFEYSNRNDMYVP
jgi:hypothetical protein